MMRGLLKLAPVVLAASALVVAGCGDDDDDTADADNPVGAESSAGAATADVWSFTDDRGVEVSLPDRPERVVAYHNAAAALIPLGVEPVAVFGGSTPDDSPLLGGLDLTGITSVGDVYGEINVEALAAAEPDLIVTLFDPSQTGPVFGFLDDAQTQAEAVAPVLALDGTADPAVGIGRFVELATSLGIAPDDPTIAADQAAFDDALAGLRAAVAAAPDVNAVAFQVYPDGVYFARPEAFPSLRLFRDAGLDVAEPEGDPGDVNENFRNYFWEQVSLELGDKYPADLVLLGNNVGAMDATQILDVPTVAARPAVAAGQIVTWQVLDRYSYDAYAAQLDALTAAIESADDVA